MELKWSLLCLILWVQIKGSNGCVEEERSALLQFKASAESAFGSLYDHLLPSWVDEPHSSNCCEWQNVTCNSSTGHIVRLSLYNIREYSTMKVPFYVGNMDMYLNMSLFHHFKELTSLNLSSNEIRGFVDSEAVKKLSNLKKLQDLDLSGNYFDRSIMPWVATLTSVKILNLKRNRIEGSLPGHDLANLQNLKILDLSDNQLNGTLQKQDFLTLENLEVLDLSWNNFNSTIPPYTWAPPSLRALSLSFNSFVGYLSSLCSLKKLEELDLRSNMFGEHLPSCLSNLISLRYLDLSDNHVRGPIPSFFSSLKSLKYINLGHNLFEGLLSFSLFANHSGLELVDFSDNKIEVETRYPGWVPPFHLKVLVLRNCHLPRLPEFLYYQFRLKKIDLSNNRIQGRFPIWLLNNNTELDQITLKNNSFNGQLHLPANSSFNISVLDVSDNHFYGQLLEIGEKMFPKMQFLNLSKNHFEGDFLFSPGDDCKLGNLDLSFNNFSGEVPQKVISSCTYLDTLKLSHNNFHGEIFTAQFNLTQLWSLHLNDNNFEGTLPSSLLSRLYKLSVLDLSKNGFHGEVPGSILNNSLLYHVNLSHNFFEGEIPCEVFSATYVDLSYNNFSGSLPSCFNQTLSGVGETLFINLEGNRLTGSIPDGFLNALSLLTLNLKDNRLSGSVPNKFGSFPKLRALLLGGNYLNGFFPSWLCELNEVSLLDLSRNSFSGSIPNCLYNLSFGRTKHNDDNCFLSEISFGNGGDVIYSSGSVLGMDEFSDGYGDRVIVNQEIEFVTKYRPEKYKGCILKLMSGLDLSENKLTGEIPFELGKLYEIHSLNLSHNQLIGSIPTTFSNLSALESLDLSYNNLSGEIPYNLIDLHSLGVFSVAYNLSGRIPDQPQLSTFDNRSFEGNPFLCGPQMGKKCNKSPNSSPMPYVEPETEDGKWYEIDHLVFFTSFSVSFAIFFVGVITILFVNPFWRRRLFYHSEQFVLSCYYFVYDTFFKLLFDPSVIN